MPPAEPEPPLPVHLQPKPPSLSDGQLVERSIARGWVTPQTPELLKGIFARQAFLATNKDVDERAATRAAKVVVDIVAQVMRDEERATSREEADRMYALALERARQSQQPDGAAPGQGGATFTGPVQIYPVQILIPDNGRTCQTLEAPNSP